MFLLLPPRRVSAWILFSLLAGLSPLLGQPLDCPAFRDPAGVEPIGISPDPGHHYFWYEDRPLVLLGASPDNSCALQPSSPQAASVQCNFGNYRAVLDSAADHHLDKLRLWVVVAGDANRADVPFKWITPAPPDTPYWSLDTPNRAYFQRLVAVVNYARQKGLFVEVTFFAPFQGADLATGAWIKDSRTHHSRAVVDGKLTDVGFSDPRYFVLLNGDGSDPNLPANEQRMAVYQKKVIEWTVDALWCFDNVFWEIASEADGGGGGLGVDPGYVAEWQRQRIAEVRARERTHPLLRRGHLMAVQPLTTAGAEAFLPPAPPPAEPLDLSAQIMNGHFTTIESPNRPNLPFGSGTLDLGTIPMIHAFHESPLIFGFNETKITSGGIAGTASTASHLNGVRQNGTLEPVRAEALEFLLNQGATYEHYGYLLDNAVPIPVRRQLGQLRLFFDPPPGTNGRPAGVFGLPGLELTDFEAMETAPARPGFSAWSSWFEPGAYPSAWNADSASKRYWAALETQTGVSPRALLYYVHHSTPRCRNGSYGVAGCGSGALADMVFGAYDARVWTSPLKYQESIRLTLGSATGTYDLTWLDPATLQPLTGGTPATPSHLTTRWNGSTCSGLPDCTVTSPRYPFDVLLRISRN